MDPLAIFWVATVFPSMPVSSTVAGSANAEVACTVMVDALFSIVNGLSSVAVFATPVATILGIKR